MVYGWFMDGLWMVKDEKLFPENNVYIRFFFENAQIQTENSLIYEVKWSLELRATLKSCCWKMGAKRPESLVQ